MIFFDNLFWIGWKAPVVMFNPLNNGLRMQICILYVPKRISKSNCSIELHVCLSEKHKCSSRRVLYKLRVVFGLRIPHKTKRGAAALARLKIYEGVSAPYDKVKRMVILDTLKGLVWFILDALK
ncbi:unnamed protein product [Arabis nemorensis]|uniref:Uncharacterized protein n=1 Tax=Arabis nemorensis TaxID=586526 RepID=A0A565CAB4_9BRAS|nr:unnamed protein product [Arabis nemorensis]